MSSQSSSRHGALPPRRRAAAALAIFAGLSGSYWSSFIWYYLKDRWDAPPSLNLLFNAGFGFFYTLGCFALRAAGPRMPPRFALGAGYAILAAISAASAWFGSPWAVGAAIWLHAFVIAWTWPNLEMLATSGLEGPALGRAVSRYNLTWAGMAALTNALMGRLYEWNSWSPFAIPAVAWIAAIALIPIAVPSGGPAAQGVEEDGPGHPLGPLMTRIARTGNMASYIATSALVPLMPAVMGRLGLSTGAATAAGAVWFAARVAAFWFLGRWHGWHFRPGPFVAAAAAMPLCLAVILTSNSLAAILPAQAALGAAVGLIYSSSLYYSMHGGGETGDAAMHEAVIGLGIMAGPLLAAAGGWMAGRFDLPATAGGGAAVLIVLIPMAGWIAALARAGIRRGPGETAGAGKS